LLLRGDIVLPQNCINAGLALLEDVINVLAEKAFQNVTHRNSTKNDMDDDQGSFHLNELMSILPSLQDGMDVNPKFTMGVTGMEYTAQLTAFELLNVSLFHGWLLDPQDADMVHLIGTKSYNELIETVIAGKDAEVQLETLQQSTSDELSTNEIDVDDSENSQKIQQLQEQVTTGMLIDSFLQSTCDQLTTYGLMELYHHIAPDTLCVLFRNNHFCTITKHNDVLYLLVTDMGYADVPGVMWEKLDVIDGDTEYMTALFIKSQITSDLLEESPSSPSSVAIGRVITPVTTTTIPPMSTNTEFYNTVAYGIPVTTTETVPLSSQSQEESDRLEAEALQAKYNALPEEDVSLALAQKLQNEEYQTDIPPPVRKSANTKVPPKKSICVIS
jgi:MINDY deubiquitinase